MCRDYERERAWHEHKALLDAEYQRRQRQQLKVFQPDRVPNNYGAPDTNPTDPAPIIRARAAGFGCELETARWWFVPSSHKGTLKDFTRKLATFNARDDNVAKSPTFRKAFVQQRCLVPASGWYEWTEPPGWKKGQRKTKWRFMVGDHQPIFFAGIWSSFNNTDPADPGPMLTFTIVTHGAGPGVDKYHDRAPIVLPAEAWADWLDPHNEAPQDLLTAKSAPDAYTVEYVEGPR